MLPEELELHPATCTDAWDRGFTHAVFLGVCGAVGAPVQTAVVPLDAHPGLRDVDFAVGGPVEGLRGQEPECRPDPGGAGQGHGCGEDAGGAGEGGVRDEAGGRVAERGVGVVGLGDCADGEGVGAGDKGVGGRGGIVLQLVVAPAVVVAEFVVEEGGDGGGGVEVEVRDVVWVLGVVLGLGLRGGGGMRGYGDRWWLR